jgi:hypothetical protein
MTDRETNTLASCGLEEHFSSCAVVLCQFLVLAGNAGTLSTFFSGGLFWDRAGNSFWCYYLVYNTVVQLCQFFCCGEKVNFVRIPYSHHRFSKILRTFFVKK